jgi:hypothetical protein
MFAHRRDFAIDGGPAVLSDLSRPHDPARDVSGDWRCGPPWDSLHWTITVRNRSAVVAFRDPLHRDLLDDRGGVVEERHTARRDGDARPPR